MNDHQKLFKVLCYLRPGAQFTLRGDTLDWLDTQQTQPTDAEISDAMAKLDVVAYDLMRAKEYPSLPDQLDAIWKGGKAMTDMKEKIQAIKTKYPKENKS